MPPVEHRGKWDFAAFGSQKAIRVVHRYYLTLLREAPRSLVAFSQFDGIDAEVFGRYRGSEVLVRLFVDCFDRTFVSIQYVGRA